MAFKRDWENNNKNRQKYQSWRYDSVVCKCNQNKNFYGKS